MTARDEVLFDAAQILLSEFQIMAMAAKEHHEKGDILVPDSTLVDANGVPIKGKVQA